MLVISIFAHSISPKTKIFFPFITKNRQYKIKKRKVERIQKQQMDDLKLKLLLATYRPFADSVDLDQTAQNVQSDLGSTLSDK